MAEIKGGYWWIRCGVEVDNFGRISLDNFKIKLDNVWSAVQRVNGGAARNGKSFVGI